MSGITTTAKQQEQAISKYYRRQSRIYDATRWSFLFGRRGILPMLPFGREEAFHILEVGCGTGYNLAHIAQRFPNARITGMDLSADMLAIARSRCARYGDRVQLIAAPYGTEEQTGQYDAILFSYSLSMINPQWADLIARAKQDLRPGGCIAVVDFHNSRFAWFPKFMSHHHVRMDGHLQRALQAAFEPLHDRVRTAYFGVWAYMMFVGKKK